MKVYQRNKKGVYYTTVNIEQQNTRQRVVVSTEQRTKDNAQQVARNIHCLLAHHQTGMPLTGELLQFVDRVSTKMRKRLCNIGILNGQLAAMTKDIKDHADDWLAAKDFSQVHEDNRRTELTNIIDYVHAVRLSDLTAERVTPYLATLKQRGLSARSRNRYRQGVIAFMNWCVAQGRVPSHNLAALSRANEKKDRRRLRRSATDDELQRFIAGVPTERKAKYLAALYTGLRRGELKQLVVGDVNFNTHSLRVSAEIDKEDRDCVIPLHPELEHALHSHIRPGSILSDRLFDSIPTRRTFYRDLERTEVRRRDERGAQLDFHALRRTMATRLLRAGVTASHAKLLTRHTSTAVLEKHYNDLHLPDATAAMNKLQWIGDKNEAMDNASRAAHCAARTPLQLANTGDQLPQPAHDAPTALEVCRTLQYLYNSAADNELREDASFDIKPLRKVLKNKGLRAVGAVG